MTSLAEKNFALWQQTQHMKPHGIIRPKLTRQETIESIIYQPPPEFLNRLTRVHTSWDDDPIRLEVIDMTTGEPEEKHTQ